MLGARMHYAVPRLMQEAGLLDRFFTDSYIGNKPWLETLLGSVPNRLMPGEFRRWLGRKDPHLPPNCVTSFDWLGIRAALALRRARSDADRERIFAETNARFSRSILRHGLGASDTVWGFNTASLELFQAAKSQGIRCILEQTILPRKLERQLLAEVAADWSGWQLGFQNGHAQDALASREEAEWDLADQIVAGSKFVAEGLVKCGVAEGKIQVIPYGVARTQFEPTDQTPTQAEPLRVLFVGEVGLRKGAPYLLEALRRLGPDKVEARFAGRLALNPDRLEPYEDIARFLGPVARSKMPDLFRWAQVFVLPSMVEGSAISSYEALMTGLPVIATPNTGTIVTHDEDGMIVPVRDIDALTGALAKYCHDAALLERHRTCVIASSEKYSVERYGRDLKQFLLKC